MKVVLLVLAILVAVGLIQAAVWIPLVRSWRKKSAAFLAGFQAETAASGERVLIAPEKAIYRGGTGSFSAVKGNGVIALTDRRLIFHKTSGGNVEVLTSAITGTRRSASFLSSRVGGKTHLVVSTGDPAELGFFVNDIDTWESAVRAAIRA